MTFIGRLLCGLGFHSKPSGARPGFLWLCLRCDQIRLTKIGRKKLPR